MYHILYLIYGINVKQSCKVFLWFIFFDYRRNTSYWWLKILEYFITHVFIITLLQYVICFIFNRIQNLILMFILEIINAITRHK